MTHMYLIFFLLHLLSYTIRSYVNGSPLVIPQNNGIDGKNIIYSHIEFFYCIIPHNILGHGKKLKLKQMKELKTFLKITHLIDKK